MSFKLVSFLHLSICNITHCTGSDRVQTARAISGWMSQLACPQTAAILHR